MVPNTTTSEGNAAAAKSPKERKKGEKSFHRSSVG